MTPNFPGRAKGVGSGINVATWADEPPSPAQVAAST